MAEKDLKTEEKILEAAAQEFVLKGRAGARMQEIADNAGINKALLHYYYRSKDLLFETVFSTVAKRLIIPRLNQIIDDEPDVFQLIRKFTDLYIDLLIKNPGIPFFILEEINKNPDRLAKLVLNSGLPVQKILDKINQAIQQGEIIEIDPRQVVVNLISLCVFPVVGRNMMKPILFQNDKAAFDSFLESRKTEVAEFIIRSIKNTK